MRLSSGIFIGEIKDGEKGSGTVLLNNGIYKGEILNYEIRGTGSIEYENNDKYIGEFDQSKRYSCINIRNGFGKLIYSNGEYYEGVFKDDQW
jgi:radial spoke head protein 1